ncbi:hypothetical protein RFI_03433, partial [Reticulomyxa filosa]
LIYILKFCNISAQGVHFHPQYFDFFYQGETREGEPISISTKVLDLREQNLIILPKRIGNNDPNRDEAFQFPLVRLANEYTEWRCNKKKSGSEKGRILGVDRYRITKQAVSSLETPNDSALKKAAAVGGFFTGVKEKLGQATHIPIDISTVQAVRTVPDEPTHCKLTYTHPKEGTTTHRYEMQSKADCLAFVEKVNFLVALSKLRP